MQLDLHGETVGVWTVLAVDVVLRKYTDHSILLIYEKKINAHLHHHDSILWCWLCNCRFFTPRQFPDDCVSVFDSKNCEFMVLKKDDLTQLCPIYDSVGKWWSQWSVSLLCGVRDFLKQFWIKWPILKHLDWLIVLSTHWSLLTALVSCSSSKVWEGINVTFS